MLTRDPRTRQQGLPYRIRRCWLPRATWRPLVQARPGSSWRRWRLENVGADRGSASRLYFSTLAAFHRAFLAIFAGLNVPLAFREPSGRAFARTYHGRRNEWLRERAPASIPFDSMHYLRRSVERFKRRAIEGILEIEVDDASVDWVCSSVVASWRESDVGGVCILYIDALWGKILNLEIQKFLKPCEYVGDFLLIKMQYFLLRTFTLREWNWPLNIRLFSDFVL